MIKISIVTPSFKRLDYFEATIDSIINQKGDFELEYIIQDAGGDDTISRLIERKCTEAMIKNKNVKFKYFIEDDKGMYDAINRGFARSSGDVLAWLNTDDMYHPNALSIVAHIFENFSDVNWITGIPNSYNKYGQRVGFDSFPNAYSQKFIRDGIYDVKYLDCGLNWIQQESTFWRRELWKKVGPLKSELKYAADFYLWQEFARNTDLVKVYSFLGGFRNHDNQLTNAPQEYRAELPDTKVPNNLKELYQMLQHESSSKRKILSYDMESQELLKSNYSFNRGDLCGRTVRWNHDKQEWLLNWELIL